ncbi:MAG: hypothetical protein WAM24_23045, partial [Ignavibacteriaceae bacterium]
MRKNKLNYLIIPLILFLIYNRTNAQTWQKIDMNFPPGDTLLYNSNIIFYSKNIGWIGTSGPISNNPPIYFVTKIFRTSDGGHNWKLQYIDSLYGGGLYFADSLHCWAYKGTNNLLYTSDGGVKWEIFDLPNASIYKMYFWDDNEGIALSN